VGVDHADMQKIDQRTIADFGDQWRRYTDNSGWYGSAELLADIIEPLVPVSEIRGKNVAEIGSGSGRVVAMLCEVGAEHVTAIEPSNAFSVLKENTSRLGKRVRCIHATGDQIPPDGFDMIFSIGVIHHIVDPLPTLQAARRALRPGGKLLIWVYGLEGNTAYLAFARPLRAMLRYMPHIVIASLAWILEWPLRVHIFLSRWLPLPLKDYLQSVLRPLTADKRRLIIYDQLRPAHAKYYREREVCDLLEQSGFFDVKTHHRHGYSWTATGQRN
jgi:SAM-dependent methyltransferase